MPRKRLPAPSTSLISAELVDPPPRHRLFPHGQSTPPSGLICSSSWCFLFFSRAASLSIVSAEPPRLSVLLRGGVAYFWRFVRAAIVAGCVAAVILGILLAVRVLLLARAGAVYVERRCFFTRPSAAAVVLLVALLVRLWWDLVEVYIVRNAMDGERRVRHALLPALRLLVRNISSAPLAASFSAVWLGVSALAFCLFLWKRCPAHQVWIACSAGAAWALSPAGQPVLAARESRPPWSWLPIHPCVAAEEIAAMVEEDDCRLRPERRMLWRACPNPRCATWCRSCATEPWANPEAAPVAATAPIDPSPHPPCRSSRESTSPRSRYSTGTKQNFPWAA